MISGLEGFFRFSVANRNHAFQFAEIFIGIFQSKPAVRTDQLVLRHIRGAKAAGEHRHAFARKSKQRAGHFLDLGEPLLAIVCGEPHDFDWLVAKQVARGIDAIDADVVKRPAAEILAHSDVAGLDLHPE